MIQIPDVPSLALMVSIISALFSALSLWYARRKYFLDKKKFEIELEQAYPVVDTFGTLKYVVEVSEFRNQPVIPTLGRGIVRQKAGTTRYELLEDVQMLNLLGIRIFGYMNIANLGNVPFWISGIEVGIRLEADLPQSLPLRGCLYWTRFFPGPGSAERIDWGIDNVWAKLFRRPYFGKFENLLKFYPFKKSRINVEIIDEVSRELVNFKEPIQVLPKSEKKLMAIMDLTPDAVSILVKSNYKVSKIYSTIRWAGKHISKEGKLDFGEYRNQKGEWLGPINAISVEWHSP